MDYRSTARRRVPFCLNREQLSVLILRQPYLTARSLHDCEKLGFPNALLVDVSEAIGKFSVNQSSSYACPDRKSSKVRFVFLVKPFSVPSRHIASPFSKGNMRCPIGKDNPSPQSKEVGS